MTAETSITAESEKIKLNQPAIDFILNDMNGKRWCLSERLGRVVTLLFYPGDETLVCRRQLCSVRDNWAKYLDTGAEVVGISPGTAEEHLKFAERRELPMPLLIDENRRVTSIYGSHWLLPIWTTRAVVVVDAKGLVRYQKVVNRAMRPTDDEVLAAVHLAQYDLLTTRRAAI